MKDYKRLTEKDRYWQDEAFWQSSQEPSYEEVEEIYYRLAELEDKIEMGELCDKKETAREILKSMLNKMYKLTGCGVPYHVKKFIEEIAMEYGVDLEDEE